MSDDTKVDEVFLTAIEYGKPPTFNETTGVLQPGEVLHYDEGTKVSDADLPNDVLDELRKGGSVGAPPLSQAQRDEALQDLASANARLEEEVAALRAQLSSSGDKGQGVSPSGPSGTPPAGGGTPASK
jgi:hypothetical protein